MGGTILLIGAGIESAEGIRVAHARGLRVVSVDGNPAAPGRAVADDFVHANIYEPEGVTKAILASGLGSTIDGVLTLGCDASRTVALVAETLGLPGMAYETAVLATDKLAMKECLQKAGVAVPWFSPVRSPAELASAVKERGTCVLKPIASRGARGVIRVDGAVDPSWAWSRSSVHASAGDPLLVEQWIDGPQISTESVLWDGKSTLAGISDRNYTDTKHLLPHVIEDGGDTPADLEPEVRDAVARTVHAAGNALGLDRGTLKGDVVLTPDGPVIIEVAARLSGGYFCTHAIPLAFGVDVVGAAIDIALGSEPDLEALRADPSQHVAGRFIFLEDGIVRAVDYDRDLVAEPWVAMFRLYVHPGQRVRRARDHTQRGGCVLTTGATRAEAITRAQSVRGGVRIDIEPEDS